MSELLSQNIMSQRFEMKYLNGVGLRCQNEHLKILGRLEPFFNYCLQ